MLLIPADRFCDLFGGIFHGECDRKTLARATLLSAPEKAYRPDIDGLRAVAILLVLVFHFNLFAVGKAGFLGVDVFFVISGYLISGLIWRGLAAGGFSLTSFYLRRLRRLAPALIVTQAAAMVVMLVMFMPYELTSAARENLATSLYVSNFYYWRSLDYFGLQAHSAILLHTWSLAIEEQFYLLYPLMLILIHRFARRQFLPILLGFVALSFAGNLWLVGPRPWAAFYLLPTRAWELGLGALLPFVESKFEDNRLLRLLASIIGVVLIGLGVALFTSETVFPGTFALLPTMGSALIILAGSGEGSPVSRLLSTAVPVALGQISYSLYLIHWPLRSIGERLLPHYGIAERWMLFALSIALATLLYRTVENPVRTRRRLVSSNALLAAIGGGSILMIAVSASSLLTHGWPQRFDAQVLTLVSAHQDIDPDQATWEAENEAATSANLRAIGDKAQQPTWLVIGDSHAAALAGAADQWLAQRKEAGLIGFRHGCLPVLDSGEAGCKAFNASVQDKVKATPSIRDVLVISIWRQALGEDLLATGDTRSAAYRQAVAAFETRLVTTIEAYRAKGVRVHIWEPVPSTLRDVPASLGRQAAFGDHWPIARTSADHRTTFAFFTAILDRHAALITSRIDPAAALCRDRLCTLTHDGRALYSDNSHPAWSSSAFYAEMLDHGIPRDPPRVSKNSSMNHAPPVAAAHDAVHASD